MCCSPWCHKESDMSERLCTGQHRLLLVLAIVNRGAMNIGVHVSFHISVFMFFRYIARSGTTGSYCRFIFSF